MRATQPSRPQMGCAHREFHGIRTGSILVTAVPIARRQPFLCSRRIGSTAAAWHRPGPTRTDSLCPKHSPEGSVRIVQGAPTPQPIVFNSWGALFTLPTQAHLQRRRPVSRVLSFHSVHVRHSEPSGQAHALGPQLVLRRRRRILIRVHPTQSACVSSSARCCPPTFSSVPEDHDELCERRNELFTPLLRATRFP